MMSSPRVPESLEALFDVADPEPDHPHPPAKPKPSRQPGLTRAVDVEDEGAPSAAFLKLVGEKKAQKQRRKARPKTMAAAVFNRALAEVDEMLRSGEWDGATVRHLVALYDRMHERCYGVEPAELGPTERFNAMMLAANMVKREFSDDIGRMIDFMLWVWAREIDREKWRRENHKPGGRIGVRLMFSNTMLTDWRVHLARKSSRV